MNEKTIAVPWPPGTNHHISLSNRLYISEDGFGNRPAVLQATITRTRYSGSYEGGEWACFPAYPGEFGDRVSMWADWDASDSECQEFWFRVNAEGWPVGRGDSPQSAYEDMVNRVCVMAGVTREELTCTPEWPPQSRPGAQPEPAPEQVAATLARADAALAADDDLNDGQEVSLP